MSPMSADTHYTINPHGIINMPGNAAGISMLFRSDGCLRKNQSSCMKETDQDYAVSLLLH